MVEDASNVETINDANNVPLRGLDLVQARLEHIAKSIGVVAVDFRNDPPDCTVRLRFADGTTGDLGREGWSAPQS